MKFYNKSIELCNFITKNKPHNVNNLYFEKHDIHLIQNVINQNYSLNIINYIIDKVFYFINHKNNLLHIL